jgi:hypothetical protein
LRRIIARMDFAPALAEEIYRKALASEPPPRPTEIELACARAMGHAATKAYVELVIQAATGRP